MRPGGGKAKGNGFEGQVAKKLSEALSPLKFIRTQSSGARVGGKNFETLGQMFGADALKLFVGDVVPVNEKESGVSFKHSIECKFYKTQDPFTSLVSGTANLFRWMQEAVDDAVKVNRLPMLIFKWNNTPIFVGCDWRLSIAPFYLPESALKLVDLAKQEIHLWNKLQDDSQKTENLLAWSKAKHQYDNGCEELLPENNAFGVTHPDPRSVVQLAESLSRSNFPIQHLTIGRYKASPLCIMYLDDLLKHPDFWFDRVIQSNKEATNESQESQSSSTAGETASS